MKAVLQRLCTVIRAYLPQSWETTSLVISYEYTKLELSNYIVKGGIEFGIIKYE